MSNKQFFGFPSEWPNGYSEFATKSNEPLQHDEFHAYNQVVKFPGVHNLFHEIILELVNLSDRTFAGRMQKYSHFKEIKCSNTELAKLFKNRKDTFFNRQNKKAK